MKITAIETVHLGRGITVHAGPVQWLWVRIHTDSGLVGLGETYPDPFSEKAVIHHRLAPVLLGKDPSRIDRLWADMFEAVAYSGWAGAELRAISAIDIALWDLAGKAAGKPIYQLLGGTSRDSIRTYNTCYDDYSFLTQPVELAESLFASGIRAMKIWPFDPIAKETRGQYITADQLRQRGRAATPDQGTLRGPDAGGDGVPRLLEPDVRAADRAAPGAAGADVAGRDAAAG
jgi:galactonate dehydratase